MQKISYIITRSHPDFHVYDCMSLHARETYNVFLALTRSYFFHRSKQEHSCEIYTTPDSYGVFSCVSFISIVECNKERKQNEYV